MVRSIFSILALGVLSLSQVAQADPQLMPFSYRVKAPVLDAGLSCADHAGQIAQLFGKASRAKNAAGSCEERTQIADHGTSFGVDVIVVNYMATSEAVPTRSVFGANAINDNGEQDAGVFATYAQCLDQLRGQLPMFIGETGVTPFVGYCTASTQTEFYPGYSITFETFGDLKNQLYSFSEDAVTADGDLSQEISAAVTALQTAGAVVAYRDDSRVFYYADGPVHVASDNLGMFEDPSQCASQVSEAASIYTAAGLTGVTAFCNTHHVTATYQSTTLMVVGSGPDEINDREMDRYDSFAECTHDLNRVLQNAASSGATVLGGLCSPNMTGASGFNAHVFSVY